MRRGFHALLVAGALAVPATAAYASPAATSPAIPKGLGVHLVDAPTALAHDPRARLYIIDHVAPGARFTRHIEVTNGTPSTLHVSLYASASRITNGVWSPDAGRSINDVARWTTVSPSSVDVAPQKAAQVAVSVSVPGGASAGERYAVVWAEAQLPSSGPVRQVARVGIREYLSVGPGGAPPTNFSIDTLTAARNDNGQPVVLAQVHNTGGRAIDLSGSLKMDRGPGGLSAGPFPAKLGTTLAPGESEPVTVLLDKALPAGPWHAQIELQSDLVRRAAEGRITFPTVRGATAAPVKAKSVPLTRNRNVLVPVAVGLIVALLGALIVFLLWRRRRRDDDDSAQRGGGGPRVPGQRRATDERVSR